MVWDTALTASYQRSTSDGRSAAHTFQFGEIPAQMALQQPSLIDTGL